jgi:hypothetical protein
MRFQMFKQFIVVRRERIEIFQKRGRENGISFLPNAIENLVRFYFSV